MLAVRPPCVFKSFLAIMVLTLLWTVRHISCDLLSLAGTSLPNDPEVVVCSFKFFVRTGKLWTGAKPPWVLLIHSPTN